MFSVIAYYKFTPLEDPHFFCAGHRELCRRLHLKGRIYIAGEGLNGTVAGRSKDIAQYRQALTSTAGFEGIDFKEHSCHEIPFDRLIVRVRPEIVTLKSSVALDPCREHGRYLTPRQWREMLESKEDFQLLDVRNTYETAIGHFAGAICPAVENFYDFPDWLEQAPLDKGRKVLMYCTGGIRCEKFSLLMMRKGFKDVYQLQGGILNYAEQEKGKHFQGKCFVFDNRLSVPVGDAQEIPVGRCAVTGVPCDQYVNCANMACNKLFLCSPEGANTFEGCCSEECRRSSWRRPFDSANVYSIAQRWYHYFDEKLK